MRRRLPLACVIALAAAAASTTALAFGAVPVPASRASLVGFDCHKALEKQKRIVSITAVMRPLPATRALSMRFQLESESSVGIQQVRGGDLGAWLTPNPATLGQNPNDVWIIRKPVSGVAVPGTYRFRVSFRWIGSDGRTLGSTVRLSNSCYQPDLRPDLLVQSINVEPAAAATKNRYIATIANAGLTAAKNVEVVFAPGGGAPDQTARIAKLLAHASHTETFVGPACTAAEQPIVTVDPDHPADDLNLSNNSLAATCPPPPATGTQPPSTPTTPAADGT